MLTKCVCGVALGARLLLPNVGAQEPAAGPPGLTVVEPLELARRFAASIRNDENDRGRSLARVAAAWLERGDPDRAGALLGEEERGHWAVVAAMADIAAEWALRGETEKARAWLSDARRRSDDLRGAGRDRALLRLARALSALGEHDVVAATFGRFAETRDYRAEVMALQALAWARAGRTDDALALLDKAGGDSYYDSRVWRARGYAQLARQFAKDADRFSPALQRAWTAAAEVPDHQRFALRLEIAEAWAGLGHVEEARARLAEWMTELPPDDDAPHIFAPILARGAAALGRLGDREAAVRLLDRVERRVPGLLQIEQPGVLALAGEAWLATGERPAALERYARAIAVAESLVNPRPRALAGLDIALSLDRAGVKDAAVLESLQRLAETFER